jgi:hypothetical protein
MKGLRKVDTEISLMFLCYDLKRVMNIMGFKGFIEAIMNFCQNLCIHFWREIENPLKKAVILISY